MYDELLYSLFFARRHGRVDCYENRIALFENRPMILFYERSLKNYGIQANEMFASCFTLT